MEAAAVAYIYCVSHWDEAGYVSSTAPVLERVGERAEDEQIVWQVWQCVARGSTGNRLQHTVTNECADALVAASDNDDSCG